MKNGFVLLTITILLVSCLWMHPDSTPRPTAGNGNYSLANDRPDDGNNYSCTADNYLRI